MSMKWHQKYAVELVITHRVINNGVNESLNLMGMLPSTLLLDKRTIQLFSTTFLSTFKVLLEKKADWKLPIFRFFYLLHASTARLAWVFFEVRAGSELEKDQNIIVPGSGYQKSGPDRAGPLKTRCPRAKFWSGPDWVSAHL